MSWSWLKNNGLSSLANLLTGPWEGAAYGDQVQGVQLVAGRHSLFYFRCRLWMALVYFIHSTFFSPQTVCPHWGVLTVTVKSRCWIEMVASVCGQFPVNFRTKWLVTCPCAFRLRRLALNGCRCRRVRHFPCKVPHKTALMTCPCAFRLHRLAQNDGRGRGVRHFPCKFLHEMALLTCPCPCRLRRLKTMAAGDASGISLVNFDTKWFLWHVHVHFDCAGSHETGVAVLVSCILPCTLGLVVCPSALRPLLGSLHRDLAKKPAM